ncbi:MAG: efflux RND transporter permease subunit, partial [Steroidobacteraceae bacterium]|nr:efflux RND transporter permease subunit [Steroidobacteraceae bacterium]
MDQNRAVLLSLAALWVAGVVAYVNMPREFEPDIEMPFVNVRLIHFGIAPEDAERLLIRPIEQELRNIEGIKEITSLAYQDGANVTIEFEAGRDTDVALADVRARVDMAKAKLPEDTEEPVVTEFRLAAQQPILIINVAGTVPERQLVELARRLKDRIEMVPGILEVKMAGLREEMLEIVIDPVKLESYGLSQAEVLQIFQRNNRIIAAGALQSAQGRFPVKVPGVFESPDDVLELPMKVIGERVVRFSDIASVRRNFKDAESFARINGEPTIAMEVVQRGNANVLAAAQEVKRVIAEETARWPRGARALISQDRSQNIEEQFEELQGHILIAVLLVVMLILGALGVRNALLVAISIPGSFLVGILVLAAMGLTMNMVTMFALIISVGIVVDGAIIVVEFADRKMAEGLAPREAYASAAQRMFWPVVCSIGTTLIAFAPLAFWPGQMGKMMYFMPITLMAVLAASIVMALLYVPVLGSVIGKAPELTAPGRRNLAIAESGNLERLTGLTAWYYRFLKRVLQHPGRVAGAVLGVTAAIIVAFLLFNPGVEFMPRVDPPYLTVEVRARGDLSTEEKDALVRQVEARLAGLPDIKYHYAKTGAGGGASNAQQETDQIGTIQLILVNWRDRTMAVDDLLAEARRRLQGLPGVKADVRRMAMGPERGKPIEIEITSRSPLQLPQATGKIAEALA